MCGRYTLRRPDLLRLGLRAQPAPGFFEEFDEHPLFNVAPSQRLPIVRMVNGQRELALARWGLVPSWTTGKPKQQPINARCETVATSAMFRKAFQQRRCLVPADGFYEWQGAKPPKQPFFVHMRDDRPFAFAGLWERWQPPQAGPLDTFTILTTQPNELMAPIHNRMPIILREADYDAWLSGDAPTDLMRPYPTSEMEVYPVSTQVNAPRNQGPQLVERETQL